MGKNKGKQPYREQFNEEKFQGFVRTSIQEIQQQATNTNKNIKLDAFKQKVLSRLLKLPKEERAKACEVIRVIKVEMNWSPDKEKCDLDLIFNIAEFIHEHKEPDENFSALVEGIEGHIDLQQISSATGKKILSKESKTLLALLYYEGIAQPVNYSLVVKYFTEAAQQDYPPAQDFLGFMYANGRGVAKNDKKAVEWASRAAAKRYACAQLHLGIMYANGHGVRKDDNQAVEWYAKAAAQGNARAQCNLGVMYNDGCGVDKDAEKAVEWYTKAVQQGHATAQYNLATMYANGDGINKDDKKAVEWASRAAAQGFAPAQDDLGLIYAFGHEVAKDNKQAVKWFEKAAAQGFAPAQYHLGVMYANGLGVVQDAEEAVECYTKAAAQGHVEAILKFVDRSIQTIQQQQSNVDKDKKIAELKQKLLLWLSSCPEERSEDVSSKITELMKKHKWVPEEKIFDVSYLKSAARRICQERKQYKISTRQADAWIKSTEQLLPFLRYVSRENEKEPDYFRYLPAEIWLWHIFPEVIGLEARDTEAVWNKLLAKRERLPSIARKFILRPKINLAIFGKVKPRSNQELEKEVPNERVDSYMRWENEKANGKINSAWNWCFGNKGKELTLEFAMLVNNPYSSTEDIKNKLKEIDKNSKKGKHSLWSYLFRHGLYSSPKKTASEPGVYNPAPRSNNFTPP